MEQRITIPDQDNDVVLVFPNGKEVHIQIRPSNADVNYNGSLDICLPDQNMMTAWSDMDLTASPCGKDGQEHIRLVQQIALEIP
jgi:hypothetical protein